MAASKKVEVPETTEGPPLQRLLRRLLEIPADFTRPPLVGGIGTIDVAAVANDLLIGIGGEGLTKKQAQQLSMGHTGGAAEQATQRRAVALAACWIYADPWFVAARIPGLVAEALCDRLNPLADAVPTAALLADDDHREELVRVALSVVGLRPEGETPAQSEDRLAALDSGARERLIEETRQAEERAAEVRRQLQAKLDEENAARMNRE